MNPAIPTPRIEFDPVQCNGAAPSPCISLCHLHPHTGLCEGCQRNIDEIAFWGSSNETEKRAIWHAINCRRAGSACT